MHLRLNGFEHQRTPRKLSIYRHPTQMIKNVPFLIPRRIQGSSNLDKYSDLMFSHLNLHVFIYCKSLFCVILHHSLYVNYYNQPLPSSCPRERRCAMYCCKKANASYFRLIP